MAVEHTLSSGITGVTVQAEELRAATHVLKILHVSSEAPVRSPPLPLCALFISVRVTLATAI